ncbi:MAG: hypothetical protein NTU43_08780 [Bacteroidetes bacterium]|nr:hypothetical protein [Bacteroidota bacterium]
MKNTITNTMKKSLLIIACIIATLSFTLSSCSKEQTVNPTSTTLQSELTTNTWRNISKTDFTIYKFYSDSTFYFISSVETKTGSYSYKDSIMTLTSQYNGSYHLTTWKGFYLKEDTIFIFLYGTIPLLIKTK